MEYLNVGTLNVQGCRDVYKQQAIYSDTLKHNINILALTRHIVEEYCEIVTVDDEEKHKKYCVYHGGITVENTFCGVGFVIEEELQTKFSRISDRIIQASLQLKDRSKTSTNKVKYHQVNIIAAYAPTLIKSQEDPTVRDNFYNELENATHAHKSNKHLLLVLGDFNAKTGSGHHSFPNNIGKYGKGQINSNGESLLEYAKENNLILTNTLFPHKLAHRTTWTCAERIQPHNSSSDGKPRRNPYINQIDYIIKR